MTSDLNAAFHGVYSSSKEILKNKQKHLYINMLDLLTRTTKTVSTKLKHLLTEDYTNFCCTRILPLVFDEDRAIQNNAISAFETISECIGLESIRKSSQWPLIKQEIVEKYSVNLHSFRQSANGNWYKIWCLLIKILDCEILRGASTINTFLSIVEMGFRSTNYEIRSQAFICWKALIEIFAKHNEIDSPKRIKLICIPLRSSQAKTPETALNKFRAWWTLLWKLHRNVENYHDTIFESFLQFSFGASEKTLTGVPGYSNLSLINVIELAIACLLHILTCSNYREIQEIIEKNHLEYSTEPFLTRNLFNKSGKAIIFACVESTKMLMKDNQLDSKFFEILWTQLVSRISEDGMDYNLFSTLYSELRNLLEFSSIQENMTLKLRVSKIIELLGTHHNFPFAKEQDLIMKNLNESATVRIQLIELIHNKNVKSRDDILDKVIENIFHLKKYENMTKYWEIQRTLITNLIENDLGVDVKTKVKIWKIISVDFSIYLKKSLWEFHLEENSLIVNKWLIWPLKMLSTFAENRTLTDDSFLKVWKNLLLSSMKATGTEVVYKYLIENLEKIFHEKSLTKFTDILASFIETFNKNFDENSKPSAALNFINYVLSKPPKAHEINDKILKTLSTYVNLLEKDKICKIFGDLKAIIITLIKNEKSNYYTKFAADEFQKTILDKLKSEEPEMKKLLKEIRDLLKLKSNTNDEFVIIPKVWEMNPDKLTERQKEKMKEKRQNIPALYNDISQSNDTGTNSIKPWTPERIVIAKAKDTGEIIIENINSPRTHKERNPPEMTKNAENVAELKGNQEETASKNIKGNSPDSVKNVQPNIEEVAEIVKNVDHGKVDNNTVLEEIKNKSLKSSNSERTSKEENTKHELNKKQNKNDKKAASKKKSTNSNSIRKGDEQFLKKHGFNIEDEKKKVALLKTLQSISIDTVEGNSFLINLPNRKRRARNSNENSDAGSIKTTKSAPNKSDENNSQQKNRIEDASAKRNTRKSINLDKTNSSTEATDLKLKNNSKRVRRSENPLEVSKKPNAGTVESNSDEFVESSQLSESIFAKRKQRDSINANKKIKVNEVEIIEIIDVGNKTKDCNLEQPEHSHKADQSPQGLTSGEDLGNPTSPSKIQNNNVNNSEENSFSTKSTDKIVEIPKINLENEHIDENSGKKRNPSPDSNTSVPYHFNDTNEKKNDVNISWGEYKNLHQSPKKTSPQTLVSNNTSKPQKSITAEIDQETEVITSSSDNSVAGEKRNEQTSVVPESESKNIQSEHSVAVERLNTSSSSALPENSNLINNDMETNANVSIISSPKYYDLEKRNEVFLNNTLDISPIPNVVKEKSINVSEKDAEENIQVQKETPKLSALAPSSPPDRKIIITHESPKLKSKSSTPFVSRGAHFINLIRSRNSNLTSKVPSALSTSNVRTDDTNTENQKETTAPTAITKSLLNFSKTLPSLNASPSASILKRKFQEQSTDDIESPANKRKRVSFHDPPVSATKEYVKHAEETKSPSQQRTNNMKFVMSVDRLTGNLKYFKRKNRIDSMLEIAKFSENPPQSSEADTTSSTGATSISNSCDIDLMMSGKDSTTHNDNSNTSRNDNENHKCDGNNMNEANENENENLTPSPKFFFPDESSLLNYVFNKYSIEDLLRQYIVSGKEITLKSIRGFIKEISNTMKENPKMKTEVMETLSEKFPKDFLDHAIQENLSSVVCDRLNPNSVLEFVYEKSKINNGMRKILLEQVMKILKMKLSSERNEFIKTLLNGESLTNDEALQFIRIIALNNQNDEKEKPIEGDS